MLRPQPVDERDATLAAAKAAAVDERRPSGNLALSIGSGYLVQVLAQATTLLTRVALARIIAPTQWGVFGEAVVIIGIVDTLRELNLTQWATSGRTTRYWRDLPGAIASTTIVLLLALVAAMPLLSRLSPQLPLTTAVLALTLLPRTWTLGAEAELNNRQRLFRLVAPQGLGALAFVVSAIVISAHFKTAWSLSVASVVQVSTYSAFLLWRSRREVFLRPRLDSAWRSLVSARDFVWLALAGVLLTQVDGLLVGSVAGATAAGFYIMASWLTSRLPFLVEIPLLRVMLPIFAAHRENRERLGAGLAGRARGRVALSRLCRAAGARRAPAASAGRPFRHRPAPVGRHRSLGNATAASIRAQRARGANRVNAPMVTVCIPVYNGHIFLERCLQAIVKQTYTNLDILVVDNQSTDDSGALLAAWAGRDRRIRVVINDTNIGLVPNRNRCIALARGEWIKFMDVDDVLAPTAIERLLEAAGSTYRMAICRRLFFYEGVDEAQRILMEREVRRYEVRELLPGRTYITPEEVARLALEYRGRNFVGEPTAVMMHRSVFDEFGAFNEDLVQIPDLEYWLRVGLHTGIAYVDEPLSCFSIHNGAASAANLALRSFRADRVDQVILLHEYLYNPYFEPVRKLAAAEGVLGELRTLFRRRAVRIAVRAALDGRSTNPTVRDHWTQWRIVGQSRPHLRPPGDALLPLAAFALHALRVRR